MAKTVFKINRFSGRAVRLFCACVWLVSFILAGGCGQAPAPAPKVFVVKCGNIGITEAQFSDELDLKLAAYPFDLKTNPEEYNAVVLDLVSVLADEVLLLAAAGDKGITVSAEALARAEARVKEDYPEDSFEQMLLENAISYRVWKNKLEKDMVIEKFVRADLIGAQEITPEDVMAFYQQYAGSSGSEAAPQMDEKILVRQLRMEKSQASYDAWMSALKAAYPVEIDRKAVAAFLEKTQ